MRIYKGHKISVNNKIFEVVGSNKIRNTYFYIVKDPAGKIGALRRKNLIDAILSGEAMVTV